MKLKFKKDSKKVMPKTRNPKTPLKVKTNLKAGGNSSCFPGNPKWPHC